MKEEYVILVNERDEEVGLEEKLEAHRKGALHRAFSIFVVNSKKEILLQRRAITKYHSGGLWTNSCCSHPRSGEPVEIAAHRRLQEEFGFQCPLHKLFSFTYFAELDGGLKEHEFDHVFLGRYDETPSNFNLEEISEYFWISIPDLLNDIKINREKYTAWFLACYQRVLPFIDKCIIPAD